MLYLKHDFYSNFSSSIDAGDNDLITDLIVNETTELVIYKRDDLLSLLKLTGIDLKPTVTDEKIIDSIVNAIPENEKLAKGLAFMIYENNTENERGDKGVPKNSVTTKKIEMIASGIIGIGDSFQYKPQLKKNFKNELLNKIEVKAKAVGDRKIKIRNSNNGIYWFLGIAVVVTAVGIYLFNKYKDKLIIEKETSKLEGGGETSIPEVPTPIATTNEIATSTTEVPTNTTQTAQTGENINEFSTMPEQAVIV